MTDKGVALGEITQIPFVSSAKLDPVFRGDLEEIDDGWDTVFQRRNQFLPKSQPHAAARRDSTNQVLLLHRSGRTGIRLTSAEIIRFRFVDRTILIDINLVEDGPVVL